MPRDLPPGGESPANRNVWSAALPTILELSDWSDPLGSPSQWLDCFNLDQKANKICTLRLWGMGEPTIAFKPMSNRRRMVLLSPVAVLVLGNAVARISGHLWGGGRGFR